LLAAIFFPVWYLGPYLLQMLHDPNTDPSFIILICKSSNLENPKPPI
jgi:hypothetical protein